MFMRVGSETKTFTVTAMLQLVDQKLVGLDDPISRYVAGVPNGDTITLRQLGEMRSGLPSYTRSPEFFAALTSNPRRTYTPQELLAYAFKQAVLFPPGTSFDYSNTNTVLLGLVVEKVTGQKLGDRFHDQLFVPAHLTETTFPNDATYPEPHPEGYTVQTADGKQATATNWNPSWGWAAGALISTLNDMNKWAKVLADGTLLKPETQAERFKSIPPGESGYGLGLFRFAGWVGHDGSLPGYQSLTLRLPERDTTMVILVNTDIEVPVQGGKAMSAPSHMLDNAITSVITPNNVFSYPPMPVAQPELLPN
jgi:D-alanyl-D-alanine carboxypeptidase